MKFLLFASLLVVLISCTNKESSQLQLPILSELQYEIIEGDFKQFPKFEADNITTKGYCDSIDVSFVKAEKYAIRYTGKMTLSEDGKYQISATGGTKGKFSLDNQDLFDFGWKIGDITQELIAGTYDFELFYLNNKNPLKLQVAPYNLLIKEDLLDKKHALYFGWEEDHPKAISLMGGAFYPRRPQLLRMDDFSWKYAKKPWHNNSSDMVCFMLGVDGAAPYYPNERATDRRTTIQWSLAENYLNAPTSIWKKDNIEIEIQHFGRRILDNKTNVVYSQITLTNTDAKSHTATLSISGNAVAERVFSTENEKIIEQTPHLLELTSTLAANASRTYSFVSPANGGGTVKEILAQGGFEENYIAMKTRVDAAIDSLTYPVSLPDDELVDLWKSSMVNMWNAMVKTPVDYEMRASGGNVYGFYQYDRTFDHDVPDMVVQYILEGRNDMAKEIMKGEVYDRLSKGILLKERYLDAVPKYIMTMAQYLQITGDRSYFDEALMAKIKECARAIHGLRENQLDPALKGVGAYGLIDKSFTLDNRTNHLVVDNFAALHGLASYKYLCEQLDIPEEAKWADAEMNDLNNCLNDVLEITIKENGSDWYNACFSFDMDSVLVSGPGNWFGTTLMMPSFPWNAYLKGFDLGGTWKNHFDPSIAKLIEQSRSIGNPEGSLGAWWSAKYGAVYNAGMAMPFLYSEEYRVTVADYVEWMLDNQSCPHQWGESFLKSETPGGWTVPVVDLETWGLGFIRQTLLQICVSNHVDGTVIIGRGIPNRWLADDKAIAWRNVRINNGKSINLSIQKKDKVIEINFSGDRPEGDFLVDIPMMVDNIASVKTAGTITAKDYKNGKVRFSADTKSVSITLKN